MVVNARVIGAGIVSAFVPALIMSFPFILASGFLPALLLNLAVWVPAFAVCATATEVMLRRKRDARLRDRLRVTFWVATSLIWFAQLWMLVWIFGSGGEEFHFGTQVVANGRITLGGVLLTLLESMFLALPMEAAYALFWFIALRLPVEAT